MNDPASDTASEAPRRPRLDPYLESIGEPVEDVSRITTAQPFRSSGPQLSRPAYDALAAGAGDLGPLTGQAERELRDAELIGPDGRPTEVGDLLTSMIGQPQARIRIESSRGRVPLTLDAYVATGRAVAVATASPATLTEDLHGDALLATGSTVHLDFFELDYLPVHLASWIGLSPAWSLATAPEELPRDLLTRRLDEPATPPPSDADEHLREVWSQPWFLWTLQSTAGPDGLVAVSAGGRGHFGMFEGSRADTALFQAVPSYQLWCTLLDLVDRTVRAGV